MGTYARDIILVSREKWYIWVRKWMLRFRIESTSIDWRKCTPSSLLSVKSYSYPSLLSAAMPACCLPIAIKKCR